MTPEYFRNFRLAYEALFDCEPNTPETDRLEILIALVESYEAWHHRIPAPDPIEAIEHEMEHRTRQT